MIFRAWLASLLLISGGVIYLAFRPEYLVMFQWVAFFGLGDAVLWLREFAAPYRSRVPSLLVFAAPNGMWLLSYCLFLSLIWSDRSTTGHFVAWMLLLYGSAVSSELLQLLGVLPGTFDWADVGFYTAAILVLLC
jgi:hypothetical protein